VTYTHRDLCIYLSRLLTAHSKKGHTRLKIWPQVDFGFSHWKFSSSGFGPLGFSHGIDVLVL
jgi:hypothetical protein